MRGFVLIFFFLPALAFGQDSQLVSYSSTPPLHQYLTSFSATDNASVTDDEFLQFVNKLEEKQATSKDEKTFLNYLFTKTHQRFLKHYREYASFSELLDNGAYNCLTGTAIYALLLNHFDVPFQIIETNYHIFLLAEADGKQILIETTDPARGFVSSETEIEKRITSYRENNIQQNAKSKNHYQFSVNLYHEVTLNQLLGLLYYNHAVNAYNRRQLPASVQYLDKAFALYQSPRMEEFSRVVLLSVVESPLATSTKEECVKKIQAMRKRGMEIMARTQSTR